MADSIDDIGRRHGLSDEATRVAAEAIRHGGGRMAQFSHPELGGMGQWSAGGMIMIGDMFNHSLKGRVQALCNDLSGIVGSQPPAVAHAAPYGASVRKPSDWWPSDLGHPSATGAQNEMRYACFPDRRRLAVMRDGDTKVYDTGDQRISGFSQQQSGGQTLVFTSQNGTVRLDALKLA
ncbi:hypothetical protein [Rhodopila sp.]|uniref:hypothetical protein n=1 Tax=Rhodopila sp. TaxID=2480087 RepID=UPI003D1308D3